MIFPLSSAADFNVISRFIFSWAYAPIRTASQRPLERDDIPPVCPQRKICILAARIEELQKSRTPLNAMLIFYSPLILLAGLFHNLFISLGLFQSLIYRELARYLVRSWNSTLQSQSLDDDRLWIPRHPLSLILLSVLMIMVAQISHTYEIYLQGICGVELKALLIVKMFKKSQVIKVKGADDDEDGDGPLLNMITSDSERIELFVNTFWQLFILLISAPIVGVLGYQYIGWPAFVYVGFQLGQLLIPILTQPTKRDIRGQLNILTDHRIAVVHDMIQGIRLLKVFAWEEAWADKLRQGREKERRQTRRMALNIVTEFASSAIIQRLGTLAALFCCVSSGSIHDTDRLMPFLNLLTVVGSFGFAYMEAVPALANVTRSLPRVASYLAAEEKHKRYLRHGKSLVLKAASFSWTDDVREKSMAVKDEESALLDTVKPQFTLKSLNLEVAADELVAVVGSVGSGKSLLLAALVEEAVLVEGSVEIPGSTDPAYFSQKPWIQSGSLKSNVLFGLPFDPQRYQRSIIAAQLDRDLNELPNGDETIVGERGINLSGGQKARVQMARVLYLRRCVYLLDDPLSAVDAHTAERMFVESICHEMQGTCRILVTHQTSVLDRCDRVVWLVNGRVSAPPAPFNELLRNNAAFAAFMRVEAAKPLNPTPMDDPVESRIESVSEGDTALPNDADAATGVIDPFQIEERATQSIPISLYVSYFRLDGGKIWFGSLFALLVWSQFFNVLGLIQPALWLVSFWGEHVSESLNGILLAVFIAIWAITWSTFRFLLPSSLINSSHFLSLDAVDAVLRAPTSFFDVTPLGRIINRFTVDVTYTDSVLPHSLWLCFLCFAAILSMLILNIYATPRFMIPLLLFAILTITLLRLYRAIPREMKRLESIRASTYIAQLAEGISGRNTLINCHQSEYYIDMICNSLDDFNSVRFIAVASAAWVNVRLALLSASLTFALGVLLVSFRRTIPPALILALWVFGNGYVTYFGEIMKSIAVVQRGMNSVQRLFHYKDSLPSEGPRHIKDFQIPAGEIIIEDLSLRYRPHLPLVLNNVSLRIKGGEKIGIIGRTGSGKTSLISALSRTTTLASGRIIIDGVDIATVGVHDLRTKLAVIPQDLILFTGTIRDNLDPAGQLLDDELIDALRKAHLIGQINTASLRLDSKVGAGGQNLSHGNRQLVALARALVRKSQVILCDEATSSVDPVTDKIVQDTIRTSFRHCTVISVAHRVKTVMLYDRICVMDAGRVVEFDEPMVLYDQNGLFTSLCKASGIEKKDLIRQTLVDK